MKKESELDKRIREVRDTVNAHIWKEERKALKFKDEDLKPFKTSYLSAYIKEN